MKYVSDENNYTIPVMVVFNCLPYPIITASSPFLITPRSNLPVITVPRPMNNQMKFIYSIYKTYMPQTKAIYLGLQKSNKYNLQICNKLKQSSILKTNIQI